MINVPSNTGQNWDEIIEKSRTNIISKISRLLKVRVKELIEFESILDPRKIESNTQSYQGAFSWFSSCRERSVAAGGRGNRRTAQS